MNPASIGLDGPSKSGCQRRGLAALVVAIVVLGTLWTSAEIQATRRVMRDSMLSQALMLAASLDQNRLGRLTGTAADLASPDYQALRRTLIAMRSANPRYRFLYLCGQRAGQLPFFYLDSEPEVSADYSPPGQVYFEDDPTLARAFAGRAGVSPPSRDRWGTWISALAPVTSASDGHLMAVFGMDVEATDWQAQVRRRASVPMLFSGLLLALVMAASGHLQRRHLLREAELQRHSEMLLRDSGARFELLLQSVQSVAVQGYAADGTTQYWNQASEQLYGYSAEEALGRNLVDLIIPPEMRTDVEQAMRQMAETGQPIPASELSLVRKDGSRVAVYSSHAVVQAPGQARELFCIDIDLAARKQAEEAVRDSEARFAIFMANLPGAAFIKDADGRTLFANQYLAELLGVEHWQDKTTTELIAGEAALPMVEDDQRALAHGPVTIEETIADSRGVLRTFQTVKFPVRLEGRAALLGGVSLDISEHKRVAAEKASMERQLLHAQKLESLGVLAGGIAHDFNNLLLAILGNADLALDDLSPMSPVRANILDIELAAHRAAELAKQMLAYSGKGRFVVEPIRLGELVEEMAHLLEVSISKKAVLKYNFAENLPTFDGDATQVRQIIMNLIINASEAIGDKSGVIELATGAMECDRSYLDGVSHSTLASLPEPLPEGVYVYIEVTDTGCGMTPETVERIFDPFFTTKFTGRGLGMSAVLGIVRGHRGAVKIHSEPGRGTTFKVLFPANMLPDGGRGLHPVATSEGKLRRGSGAVLIVDDEETVRAVCRSMLERIGYEVLAAADGREALRLFSAAAANIVCVLLDLTMPHMDGAEAFRELRRIKPDVKVVLCSGYSEQDATRRFAGKGPASFLQKPYTMAALHEKVAQVLEAE